jgi:hypothetical protein
MRPKPPVGIMPVSPVKPVKPGKGGGRPTKPVINRPTKPQPDPVKEPVMDAGYRPDIEGMKKGVAASRKKMMGMAYGGMTKKGMAKGGMANCGASMKPAQGKGKK